MNWPTRRSDNYPALWNAGVLHRSIDDLLEDFFGGVGTLTPAARLAPRFEVSEVDGAIVELPGIDE